MSEPIAIDDATRRMVGQLEKTTLESLSHEDHVRAAWYYLVEHGLLGTLERLPGVLRRFAASKGAADHYHETITFAYTCLIHERLSRSRARTWPEFAAENPDLLEREFLGRYYDAETLKGTFARRVFVLPDPASGAFVDDFDMEEIETNRDLLARLKKGSQDAREGKGRFVG